MAISLSTYTPHPTSPSRSGGVLVQGIPVEPKGFVERCIPLFDLAFRLSTLRPPPWRVLPTIYWRALSSPLARLKLLRAPADTPFIQPKGHSHEQTPVHTQRSRNPHPPPTNQHGAKTIRPLRDLPQPACVEVCSEGHSHGHARLHTQMPPRSTRQTTRPFRLGLDQSQPRAARAPCVTSTGHTHRIPPQRIIPTAGSPRSSFSRHRSLPGGPAHVPHVCSASLLHYHRRM